MARIIIASGFALAILAMRAAGAVYSVQAGFTARPEAIADFAQFTIRFALVVAGAIGLGLLIKHWKERSND
jgi:hypothetical protein